ncbi:restriction endonuclease [Granulicoccus sp. GXG6511]|uniref:restriction endonuclease n=1 Tax=Granulicoccus sp. GXG6511 TaxID=3381351 RepID=UPI003D7C8BBD
MPPYQDFLWPSVVAVRELGSSASIEEMLQQVITVMGFSEEQQAVLHGDGPGSEIAYRLAWARTYLKKMGLMTNSSRGVWALTDQGKSVQEHEILPLRADALRRWREESRREKPATDRAAKDFAEADDEQSVEEQDDELATWRDQLLDTLMRMDPVSFEHLAVRLLREAGFTSTSVTGRSHDGGIDGVGTYRMSLLSFPVYFQCKRYQGSVGAPAVRDFRGAMAGRGDKGLLITTGSFSSEARKEATRDGAQPIDLIEGNRLCDLLKEYKIGVTTTVRRIEDVRIDADYFDGI